MKLVPRKSPPALHVPGSNRLLTLLDAGDRDRIMRRMDRLTLKRRTAFFDTDESIEHVFFPLSGVASFVINMADGPSLEVGTVGNEGFAGTPLLMGSMISPTDCFVQVEGEFLRLPASTFLQELEANADFAGIMRRYAQGFFRQIVQSTACLQFHPVEQRLCRWILMSHDRAGTDKVGLTQEFLAMMLGVQRPTVTVAATTLQKAGLIKYRRGEIEVLDRVALEQSSCECYAIVRKEYERLLC